eukprot:gene8252-8926_t
MITSWVRLLEMNNDQIFEYLTQDEILKVMSTNLGFRDLSICQIRVERRQLLELFRNADRWKDLLHRMKDPSKQLIVNQSKRVIQVINKHLTVTSKSEFLKCLKEFPVYSIIPPTLHFPSLYSLTIEYELFFFICELNQKNHYNFTIQSLKLFTFASPSHKMRKAVASWIEPYLPLATKKLFIQGWPYNKMNTENNQFFPNLSSTLEVLSFHHCGSLKLHENSLPNLQTLVLRHTIITNLKDLASLKVLELSHQFHMNAKNIPKVKKLILKKCYYISHLKTLQGIEEVEIINCKITNYMNVLKDVKRLSIDITQHHSGMYSDSEQEDNDDDVNEEGSLYEGQFLHNSDCEDEEEESNESDDDKHDEDEDEDEQHNEEEEEDDEAGDTQGALNFDLSQYSQLQRVKVLSRSFSVEGPLISKDLPKTLKTLTFLSYTTAIDPFILYFSNLHMVEIGHCHQINSLYGLGNVRRLKLIYLNALTSLDGLGGNYNGSKSDEIYQNEFVQITLCDHITDFSPLKHVKEIDINDCVGFRNGFDVDHVHTLTISSCKNIVDVSMLHQLQRLKFLKCDGILSLKGLEDVPNLSFESCRHLQLQHHKEPVFKKDYGIRIMSDALTSLPDSLYPQMLTYLGNQDRLSMIHCNCYLYQRLIRKYRIFQLKNYRIVELFFTDSLFRDKLFDRMEDSSKQLILQEPIMLVNFSDPTIFCINGWNKLSLSVSSFLSLLQAFPNAFPNVSILHLMNYSHYSDYDSAAAISSLNTTVTVKDRLTLEGIKIRSSIKLPETLKHLMLDDCSLSIENLQTILFTLKTLTIQHHTKLTNIELFNFNNLHTLILKNMKELINLKLFNKVKQLFLYDCHRLQNLDSLQDNEKIVVDFSMKTVIVEQDNDDNNIENGNNFDYNDNLSSIRNPKLMNLLYHFSNSKSIELTFTDHKVAIDLSYYDNIERFTLTGSLHTFSQQRSIPSFYTKNIPTPLKVLKLHGVMNLETLGEGNFDHLQYIELVRCGLTSLVGLGNVKFVRLEDLPDLSSLEGLGNRNRKVILKDLMSLDFEPVKNVYDLTLIGCTHFTSMPMVYGIKRLRFEGRSNFEYLRCEDLEQLEVCRCNKLKTIQGMGRVAKLIIKDCVCLDDYPEGKKWN